MVKLAIVLSGLGKSTMRSLYDNVIDFDIGYVRHLMNPRNSDEKHTDLIWLMLRLLLAETPQGSLVLINRYDIPDLSDEGIADEDIVMLVPDRKDKFHYMTRLFSRPDSPETNLWKKEYYTRWDEFITEWIDYGKSRGFQVHEVPYGKLIDTYLGLKSE